ncbi:MAG: VWA domain-containing protein [Acidobacteria bacterium]|nr:VWA domain-containing protein [Acidobacteriota bacterium]
MKVLAGYNAVMVPWPGRFALLACVAGMTVAAAPQQPPAGAPPRAQAQQQQSQQPQQPPPPVFRAGVKLVRVDLTVTGKGDKPVADMKAEDFDVTEDGVPQKVEQIQYLQLDGNRPVGDETSLEIRSQEQAEAEAARDDVRVFAIFLDDYHVDKVPQITIPIRRGLTMFINQLWPSDLVVIMDPLTPLSALRFTRSKDDLLRIVNSFEGRQGEVFPIKSVLEEAQLARGDVRRVRAEVTLSALAALTMKLGGLKEGRKSIIFVSQGPPTYTGSRDGNLQDRMRDITQAASRGNVTIYPVDPRGLSMEPRLGDAATLYQLAGETGGRAIINTNDFSIGLGRMLQDVSAYYVLGYTPTRAEDDGKYHKITVKSKRSGVHITARQGYWAPSAKELEAAAVASAKTLEPRVTNALGTLAQQQPGKQPVDLWMGTSRHADGQTLVTVAWDVAEPPPPTPVAVLDVEVTAARGGLPPQPIQRIAAPVPGKSERGRADFVMEPGEVSLRMTARAADGGIIDRWTRTLLAPDYAAEGLIMSSPRLYRSRSLQEFRAIQASPDPTPSAVRQFSRADRVIVQVDCYGARLSDPIEFSAHVQTREGQELATLPSPPPENGRVRFELPVGSFGQGTYILRLQARTGARGTQQLVAFRVAR